MSHDQSPRLADVFIEKFSKKGNGLGFYTREDGERFEVEVPFALPGETVTASLLKRRRGLTASKLFAVKEPSKDRILPKCIHFGTCGGCRLQQLAYEKQLSLKQKIVEDLFKDLISSSVSFGAILPSPKVWNYRNKMEFSFSSDKEKNRYLGLMIDNGRGRVFELTECHLSNPWFAEVVACVRDWWKESGLDAYHPYRNTGHLRTLTVREANKSGDRMVNLTVSGNPDFALKKSQIESFVAFVRDAVEPLDPEKELSIFLTIHQAIKGKPTQFYEMHLYGKDCMRETLRFDEESEPLNFHVSPRAFFQPNTEQAENLYRKALSMVSISSSSVVYDLYCGTGTLGILAAKTAKEVVGIELSRESSLDARENAKRNGIENITILTGSVGVMLQDIEENKTYPKPNIVMVDPPRAGLEAQAIAHIISLNPEKILYISCNPKTQVENISVFIQAGWQLEALQPVDQFPHTIHIENIAVLKK